MADQPFGAAYASNYDLMYGEKDYEAECDLLESLFERHSPRPVRSILDLGCGTGNHLVRLAARGYQLTGVDQSEQMLEAARGKLNDATNPEIPPGDIQPQGGQQPGRAWRPQLVRSGIQTLDLGRQYDAVLMMFAVMGYLATDRDLQRGLQVVRQHLAPGGLFVADFWYGPAVVAIGPSVRTLRLNTPDGELLRTATPRLDAEHHRCTVHYQLSTPDGTVQAEETHTMRYFFPDELQSRLGELQLEILAMHPFLALEGAPDQATWNALLCARAI